MSPRAIPTTGHVIALPTGRLRRPAEAQILPVAAGVSALSFELGADTPLGGRLTGEVDGAALRGPLVSTTLALRSGGTRHVLLVGTPASTLLDRRITLSLGRQLAAAIEPDWLQSPVADPAALIEGLAEEGRRRLLKLFLTTGASLFGAGAAAEFATAAEGLLTLLGLTTLTPAGCCRMGAGSILSYAVPSGFDATNLGDLVILARGRTRRLAGCKAVVERRGRAALLHLGLPRPLPAGAALVATGAASLRLSGPAAGTAVQPLGRWLAGRDAATHDWAQALVEAAAATDPAAAALAHEMRWLATAPPSLAVAHLSATPHGLLYAVRLTDPRGLVRGLAVERGGAAVEVPLAPRPGAASVGYVPLPRASRIGDAARLRLVLHSGQAEIGHAARLAAFDGALPPLAGVADAAAVARARLDREEPAVARWAEDFGTPPRRTRLVVVAPLGPDLDILRVRAALVSAEAGRRVLMIVTVADGPAAEAARSAIAQAVAVHGVAHRLVVAGADADAGARLVAALAQAGTAPVLLLGADVLPARGAGLGRLLRRVTARRPMLRGALADHEGQETDAGPAACVALAPAAVAALLAAGAVYPCADVLVADAARRLGVALRPGGAGGFVRYGVPGGRGATEAAVDAWALRLMAEGRR